MKCTTKILIAILISGMVVVFIGSILLYNQDAPQKDLTFDGKATQVNVEPFRVVNVLVNSGEGLAKGRIVFEGNLTIVPISGAQHTLSYPEGLEHYLSIATKDDTLNLVFNVSAATLPDEFRDMERIFMKLSEMKLTADSSLIAASSEACKLNLQLLHLKGDSVALNAYFLKTDCCDFRSLSVKDAKELNLENSRIDNAYLDLDGVCFWSVTQCRIENGYLTGSGDHYNELQKGEYRRMHWRPKTEDAQLRVVFKGGASVSLLN